MISIAIKILAIVTGIWSAFASYGYLNLHLVALLAFIAAIAVGVLAGAVAWYILEWIFTDLSKRSRP